MKIFLFIIVFTVSTTHCLSWFPPLWDTKCGFTRSDALACVLKYGDINNDEKLTPKEIGRALDKLVPGWIKELSWFTHVTVKQTMKDCDYNKDGVITPSDWDMDGKQEKPKCIPTKKHLCTFEWFCKNAKKNAK